MAIREVILKTADDGGAGDWHGDAFARTSPTLAFAWNSTDGSDFIGTDNKDVNPENVMFLRYKINDAWPKGALLLHAMIAFNVPGSGVTIDGPEGKFRLGQLVPDGIWDDPAAEGWREGVGAGLYPDSRFLPFPTDPDSDVIKPGKIVFNAFLGTVSYDETDEATLMTVGDEGYSPVKEFPGNFLASLLQSVGPGGGDNEWVAYVVDPFEVPFLDPESITFLTDDLLFIFPKGTWGPKLHITYDEQPPTITSAPGPAFGSPGVLYDYGPLTANDPAPGNSATVTFDLVDPEDGMTVINDGGTWRFDWTPSLTAPGVYLVQLRATDEDGFTSVLQTWTVTMLPLGEVCSELEIVKAVDSSIDVSPSVDETLKVTPKIEGTLEVEKCR